MIKILLVLMATIQINSYAYAKENMFFYGTLIDSVPCESVDNEQIDVSFGLVNVNKLTDADFSRQYSINFRCSEDLDIPFKLSLQGTKSGFDSYALATSKENLGLKHSISLDGNSWSDLAPGDIIDVSAADGMLMLKFRVYPIANESLPPDLGDFSANASIKLDYN
ncbi:fimbrial protein [Salmonella enterica]|nr:fimbrial protein [Salmonella enterica]